MSASARGIAGTRPIEHRAAPTARSGRRSRLGSPRRVLVVCAALAMVFGCGLYLGTAVMQSPSLRLRQPIGLTTDAAFMHSRIGGILFETADINVCRKVPFNNATGQSGTEQTVRCDTGSAEPSTGLRNGGERMLSIRDAFKPR
jgi:hypothetical protein